MCGGGGGGGDDQSHRVHVEWYAETDSDTDSVCMCVCGGGDQSHRVHVEWYAETDSDTDSVCVWGVISLTGSMLNGMLRLIVILITDSVCVCGGGG